MEEILVNLVPATELGRMHYSPRRSKISYPLLFVESAVNRKMDYAIVINNASIVLMFDNDGILINAEFTYLHHNWNTSRKFEDELPVPSVLADLKLVGVRKNRKSMVQPRFVKRESGFAFNHYELDDIPIEFCSDSQFTFAKIIFGKQIPSPTWVELSENCMALVSEQYLKGFFINLSNKPNSMGVKLDGFHKASESSSFSSA